MMAAKKVKHNDERPRPLGDEALAFRLTHGRAMWVLTELGFAAGASNKTFNYYIKSLRKFGVPFGRNEDRRQSRQLAHYSYDELMELSLALILRVYGWLPDPVLTGLVRFRRELNSIYREAYIESQIAVGCQIRVCGPSRTSFRMTGLYLDLQIRYSGGRLIDFGPPKALTPYEALHTFAIADVSARTHLPLNLSALALQIVDSAQRAPDIRRGPVGMHQKAKHSRTKRVPPGSIPE